MYVCVCVYIYIYIYIYIHIHIHYIGCSPRPGAASPTLRGMPPGGSCACEPREQAAQPAAAKAAGDSSQAPHRMHTECSTPTSRSKIRYFSHPNLENPRKIHLTVGFAPTLVGPNFIFEWLSQVVRHSPFRRHSLLAQTARKTKVVSLCSTGDRTQKQQTQTLQDVIRPHLIALCLSLGVPCRTMSRDNLYAPTCMRSHGRVVPRHTSHITSRTMT